MKMPFFDINAAGGAWAMEEAAYYALSERLRKPQALQAVRPDKADRGKRLGVRDGVGILFVEGPLFKRKSWITEIFGFTDYETLRQDLQVALDDKRIEAIALHVDSPGGEANGCDELAAAIYAARGQKPTAAFVSGMACSGAYWLASAAQRVVVSDGAILGSIGAVVEHVDRRKADERKGISRYEFVSSMSPGKRPDVTTDRGRARVQKMVDDLGHVFVAHVAKHRGVTPETVVKKFGQGGVEIGANAVKAGMADAVGTFEAMLADLKRQPIPLNVKPLLAVAPAKQPTYRPTPAAQLAAPRVSNAERQRIEAQVKAEEREMARIRAICQSEIGRKYPEQAAQLAFETTMTAEEATAAMRQHGIAAIWREVIRKTNP